MSDYFKDSPVAHQYENKSGGARYVSLGNFDNYNSYRTSGNQGYAFQGNM